MAFWLTELQRIRTAMGSEAARGAGMLLTRATERLDRRESLRFITDGFPEYMAPYLAASGDLAATLYEDLPGGIDGFRVTTADLPLSSVLAATGRYLLVAGLDAAVEAVVTKWINGAFNDTTFENLGREYDDPKIIENPEVVLGTLWARHASANACGFCRAMATKGPVFRSEASATTVVGRRGKARGTRKLGDRWHDNCHCAAIAVRPGGSFTPAAYVEQWQRDYDRAVADGHTDIGAIANAMDYGPGGRRHRGKKPAPAAPKAPEPASAPGSPPAEPPKPPTGGQSVHGGDEPGKYPTVKGGGTVPFTPDDPPEVTDELMHHIMVGSPTKNGWEGGHAFGAGHDKTEFPEGWDADKVRAAIESVLRAPGEIQRLGSTLYFRGVVDGQRLELRVRGRSGPPKLWTAYPIDS